MEPDTITLLAVELDDGRIAELTIGSPPPFSDGVDVMTTTPTVRIVNAGPKLVVA